MIEESHHQIHEIGVTSEDCERQRQYVERDCEQGFAHLSRAKILVVDGICTSEQGPPQEKLPVPSHRRDDFKGHGLIAPNEFESLVHHSTEEIGVLTPAKFRPEDLGFTVQDTFMD